MPQIDLNCDMGEGFPYDEMLMPYISSANIACGLHAGDRKIMKRTIELASSFGVAAGAHPSFPDRKNFGRVDMELSPSEVYDLVVRQVELLCDIAISTRYRLSHVKPHGALYNHAARDREMANAIARAIHAVDNRLFLFGLSGSLLIQEAKSVGLTTLEEAFADRTYQEDGSLTSRSRKDAMITDPSRSAAQVLQMVLEGTVGTTTGKVIPIRADTICLHGDTESAPSFARNLRKALDGNGIVIAHW